MVYSTLMKEMVMPLAAPTRGGVPPMVEVGDGGRLLRTLVNPTGYSGRDGNICGL